MNTQQLYEMVRIEDLLEQHHSRRETSKALQESSEGWGVGDKKDAQAFDKGRLESGQEFDLIFGQYPHIRRDDNIYARFEDGTIVGFAGHRPLVDVELKSYNYMKESDISGNEIRRGGTAFIRANGNIVYGFFYRDPLHALDEVKHKLVQLSEHPSDIFRSEGMNRLAGRKVYYRDTPAVVETYFPDQGAVVLRAEAGSTFTKPAWWKDDYWEWTDTIKTDLLSNNIWWWRD